MTKAQAKSKEQFLRLAKFAPGALASKQSIIAQGFSKVANSHYAIFGSLGAYLHPLALLQAWTPLPSPEILEGVSEAAQKSASALDEKARGISTQLAQPSQVSTPKPVVAPEPIMNLTKSLFQSIATKIIRPGAGHPLSIESAGSIPVAPSLVKLASSSKSFKTLQPVISSSDESKTTAPMKSFPPTNLLSKVSSPENVELISSAVKQASVAMANLNRVVASSLKATTFRNQLFEPHTSVPNMGKMPVLENVAQPFSSVINQLSGGNQLGGESASNPSLLEDMASSQSVSQDFERDATTKVSFNESFEMGETTIANQNSTSQEVESGEKRSYHAPILMLANSKTIAPSELVTEATDRTGPAQAAEEITRQENREYYQNILPLAFSFAILTGNAALAQANASRSIAKSVAIMRVLEMSHIAPAFSQGISRVGNSARLLNEYVAARTGPEVITANQNAESPLGGVSSEIFTRNFAVSLPEANYPKNVTAPKGVIGEISHETKSPTTLPRKPRVKIQGIYDSNISREESEESELVELRRKISRILAEEFRRFYGTK